MLMASSYCMGLEGMWTDDGVVIYEGLSVGNDRQITPDGNGGVLAVWAKGTSIMAQGITSAGYHKWFTPITVANPSWYSVGYPKAVSDNNNGMITTWQDDRNGQNPNIYAQRVGSGSWTTNGVAIRNLATAGTCGYIRMIPDGAGGAIIGWLDQRANGTRFDIYAQRINQSGTVLWTVNGVVVCNAANTQIMDYDLASDGNGGVILAWADSRGGTANAYVYAQRLDSAGAVKWTSNGTLIASAANDRKGLALVSDGSNGAILIWQDKRSGNYDVYGQRINSAGTVQWTSGGIALCNASGDQTAPNVVNDGANALLVVWNDTRTASKDGIYLQKYNLSGVAQWTANGVEACTALSSRYYQKIIADGSGGAIVHWIDFRTAKNVNYVQRVDAAGNTRWAANGEVMSDPKTFSADLAVVSDSNGGAISVWYDNRNGGGLYAQRILRPRPHISSVNTPAVLGTLFSASVIGRSFNDDRGTVTAAKLTRTASSDIVASNLVVSGANSLTCTFDVTATSSLGDWSLVLTDSLSQKSIEAITVSVVAPTPTTTPTPAASTPTPTPSPTAVYTSTPVPPEKFLKIYHSQINPNRGEKAVIRWTQPQSGPVTITIYNMVGDKIVVLADHQEYSAGNYHEMNWNGVNQNGQVVGSGIYIVHLKTAGYDTYSKIAIIK